MVSAKIVVFAACRALGLFIVAGWLTRRHLKMVCYHGFELDDETQFRPKLFIGREAFEQRLRTIRRYGMRVLELDDAIQRLYDGSMPDRPLVVTIDDGFHSVHRVAAPLLKRYRIPATVYITTYYVERQNPIFRLAIQYLFWKTKVALVALPQSVGASDRQFDLGDPIQRENASWIVIRYGETRCSEQQRLELCAEIGRLLEVPFERIAANRTLHLMTPVELNTLADSGLTVELHTHRHVFPDDDKEAAQREITDNSAVLRKLTNRSPVHFCYPSGLWTEIQWSWLDAMGIRSSTTCLPGLNSSTTPRHALHRFLDGSNIHPLEFEAALCGFSDLLRSARERLRG